MGVRNYVALRIEDNYTELVQISVDLPASQSYDNTISVEGGISKDNHISK